MSTADARPDAETIQRIISLIDLTDLDDAHRDDGLGELFADAATHGTAAVCIWPEFVARAAVELAGSGVRIATVANFPDAEGTVSEVAAEVASSLAAGANEIDVVLPWRRFVAGDVARATEVVETAARIVHDVPNAILKVILETGELGGSSVIAGVARCAIDGGADFVKTSTGKMGSGATADAVATMLDVIKQRQTQVGIKPSGGIRTVAEACTFLDLAAERFGSGWATPETFRFGASSLLTDALEALDGTE